MANTKIVHIQGNEITIGFPIIEMCEELRDGSLNNSGESYLIENATVVLRRGLLVRQYQVFGSFNYIHFTDKGHLPCGEYDIEVYFDSSDNGQHMRFKEEKILCVVDSTAEGQKYQSSDYDVVAYYPVINGRASAVVIGNDYVALIQGNGLNADIGNDSVNLRAGFGSSEVVTNQNNVNINIKD